MITNLQNNNHPSFGIKVSEGFKKAAHNYLNGGEYRNGMIDFFDKKVEKVVKDFGYDEFTITYKNFDKNGKRTHALFAESDNLKVQLTEKDHFRKIIEKFLRLNKGELYVKIKQFRRNQANLNK